jgi:glycosyltransferase involved in cell wall biosynthesis
MNIKFTIDSFRKTNNYWIYWSNCPRKGILEFMDSIPIIIKSIPNAKFLIGGSGDLFDLVKERSEKLNVSHGAEISIPGWIGEELRSN